MKAGPPGDGGGGKGAVGRGAVVMVITTWAAVGIGTVAATERICHTPSGGSVTVRSSSPAPVEESSGEPGPWSAPAGLIAKISRSLGAVLLHVYLNVSLTVLVW